MPDLHATTDRPRKPSWLRHAMSGLALLFALVLVSPLFVLVLLLILAHFALTVLLYILVWLLWNSRGINLLYVYSNSPNWQQYIEQQVLPRLPEEAVVLNWSERKHWRFSLATLSLRHFGGESEFNPMGIIFRPFRRARIYRFHKPFLDLKHGKPEALQRMETEFFGVLNG